jgi:transcriptional regulator with XRE-family HTH domain
MNKHTMPRRNRLKALLEKLKAQSEWSASKLAEKIGVSKQTVSNWLDCRVDPEVRHLEAIAKVANLSLNSLIAYLENKPELLDEIGLDELTAGVEKLGVIGAIKVAEASIERIQSWLSFAKQTQEAIMDHQNVQNELIAIVRAKLETLGEEEFLKKSKLTKASLDSVLEGERPNTTILVLIIRVLPEVPFSRLCELVDSIYGDLKPPAMPWLQYLLEPKLPEDPTDNLPSQ